MIKVQESVLYNSLHLYPVNCNDTKRWNVIEDGKFIESFSSEKTAKEFVRRLKK